MKYNKENYLCDNSPDLKLPDATELSEHYKVQLSKTRFSQPEEKHSKLICIECHCYKCTKLKLY